MCVYARVYRSLCSFFIGPITRGGGGFIDPTNKHTCPSPSLSPGPGDRQKDTHTHTHLLPGRRRGPAGRTVTSLRGIAILISLTPIGRGGGAGGVAVCQLFSEGNLK